MGKIYNPPNAKTDQFGNLIVTTQTIENFNYLLGANINSIIPFDDSTEQLKEQGELILPRHFYLFEGVKDGEIKFKPYEYDPHRIVVSTYKGIIVSIDSLG